MIDHWVNKITETEYNSIVTSLGNDIPKWFISWRHVYKDVDGKGIIRLQKLIVSEWAKAAPAKKGRINARFGKNLNAWYISNRVRLSSITFPDFI